MQKEKIAPEKEKLDEKTLVAYHDVEEKMKAIFGTKVSINAKDNKKGKIEIEYYSMDEFNRIFEMFQTIHK